MRQTSSKVTAAAAAALLALGLTPAPATAQTGQQLFVNRYAATCSDTGPGSQAQPFCRIQRAADVVNPGQTIVIEYSTHTEQVRLTRSGTAAAPVVISGGGSSPDTGTGLTIDGASHVVVRKAEFSGPVAGIVVTRSSDVEIDEAHATRGDGAGVLVTGGSTSIRVLRTWYSSGLGIAVRVEGGSGHTISGTEARRSAGVAIAVSDAPGTAITGNTVEGACGAAVVVAGVATGSVVANNILTRSRDCGTPPTELAVDPTAAATLAVDHNILFPAGTSAYSWAGTSHANSAAFTAATGRGAGDLTTDPRLDPSDFEPLPGSPALDSANAGARGARAEPRADDPRTPDTGTGAVTHLDRGAVELVDRQTAHQPFSVNTARAPVGGAVTVRGAYASQWGAPFSCVVDFGDGFVSTGPCTVSHAYSTPANRTVRVVATTATGLRAEDSAPVQVVSPTPLAGRTTAIASGPRGATVYATAVGAWSAKRITVDFGDGEKSTQDLDPSRTDAQFPHVYARLGTYAVTTTYTDAGGATTTTGTPFTTAGSDFTAHGPLRVLDTRVSGLMGPYGTRALRIGGANGIPAGVSAVAVNLTVVDPTHLGFLTAWAGGGPRPVVSNVNFAPGLVVPNLAVVPVAANGDIQLYNGSAGTSHVLADVVGYFRPVAGGTFSGGTLNRVLDTRTSGGPLAAGSSRVVATGQPGTSTWLNLTVTEPDAIGFVVAYPGGTPRPGTSTINHLPGQTVANSAIVPVGPDGTVRAYTVSRTHLLVDAVGTFAAGSGRKQCSYIPRTPSRTFDSREPRLYRPAGPVPPMAPEPLQLFPSDAYPSDGAGVCAAVANLTVTEPGAGGYLTVSPGYGASEGPPTGSNLNFTPGQTVANLMAPAMRLSNRPPQPPVGPSVFVGGRAAAHVIVDAYGYFDS